MRLAPGAWRFTLPWAIGAAVAAALGLWLLGVVLGGLGLGVLAFHRDPERPIGPGIVAPSDGVVAEASTGPAGGFVAAFLNVHNVHVIRAPLAGTVLEVRKLAGPRRPAWSRDARHNAGAEVRMDTGHGEVRVRMLVGFVARRVVPYVAPGQDVAKGERIGLIRFGSRTEVVLPPRSRVTTRPGARLQAGTSTIAEEP